MGRAIEEVAAFLMPIMSRSGKDRGSRSTGPAEVPGGSFFSARRQVQTNCARPQVVAGVHQVEGQALAEHPVVGKRPQAQEDRLHGPPVLVQRPGAERERRRE